MPQTYEVKLGESLSKIGSQFGLDWREIFDVNKEIIGPNPDIIQPGQLLTIPEKKPAEEANEQDVIDEDDGAESLKKNGIQE